MWSWIRKPNGDGFPEGFSVQRVGIPGAEAISELSPDDTAKYFRDHPETAQSLLHESSDKRFTPSTFIVDEGNGAFSVGWLTRDAKRECVKEFSDLADAATDYVLFSLGKHRWTPDSAND
jgi:hypothetical protein